jgi:hypothetical protein
MDNEHFPQTQKLTTETENLNNKLTATSFALQQSQNKLDSLKTIEVQGRSMLKEIKEFYPQIIACSYAVTYIHPDTVKTPIVIYTSKATIYRNDRNKIINWTKSRLKNEKAKIYFE